jgi:hypothetical protein
MVRGYKVLRLRRYAATLRPNGIFPDEFPAIEIACRQQAKSLELRAVMSLSRLWQQQGKIAAREEF